MKLGLGLSRHQLDLEHYRFARQCGCTHLALSLAAGSPLPGSHLREVGPAAGYAPAAAEDPDALWTYESLSRLTEAVNAADLQVGAVEQFCPLVPLGQRLNGTRKKRWLDRLKRIIRQVGSAGIPVIGYEVPLSGESPRVRGSFARGDAETFGIGVPTDMTPSGRRGLAEVLGELVPVAEEAGVTLAARMWQPGRYREVTEMNPGVRHAVEFGVAGVAAAAGDGVYAALETCLREKRLACLRVGNVRSGPPGPYATFVDEGDIDLLRIARLLRLGGYRGMIVPDHAPQMTCVAPWHAGTAHTLGYLKAALQASEAAE